jgi:hypothetical protein
LVSIDDINVKKVRGSIGFEPCGSPPVLFEEPAGPGFSAKS